MKAAGDALRACESEIERLAGAGQLLETNIAGVQMRHNQMQKNAGVVRGELQDLADQLAHARKLIADAPIIKADAEKAAAAIIAEGRRIGEEEKQRKIAEAHGVLTAALGK
jgi:hypothetical protein